MTDNKKLIIRTEPWITESAIELIKLKLTEKAHVFEFGSGASTLWFLDILKMGKLVTVDNHRGYFEEINRLIKEKKSFCLTSTVLVDEPYNNQIEIYKDDYFDLVLVDGRNRNACIRSAIPKLKKGGWLVLDNSERHHYEPGKSLMSEWNQIHCQQRIPDKYGFYQEGWTTSIYIKP